jgi:cobalt-precorrin 5A hydrolase
MSAAQKHKIAIWVITPNGIKSAQRIAARLPDVDVHMSGRLNEAALEKLTFDKLSEEMVEKFMKYAGHIFIMSTGIVVRVIAPLIQSKTEDPAVVVIDDQGQHAISLLSGHLGGANALTLQVAEIIGARPVITTATDVNRRPAIDVLAKEKNMVIENPGAIKIVNMALLTDQKTYVHDRFALLQDEIPNAIQLAEEVLIKTDAARTGFPLDDRTAAIFVGDRQIELPPNVLILRPATLVAGIGCNRNTPMEEIKDLLDEVLKKNNLASACLSRIATIDLKADEPGIVELAKDLNLLIEFFSREELSQVEGIQTPSAMVEKHIGVKSVCEAAAILASRMGTLIVPKQTTPNVTVAIARKAFIS